MNCRGGEGRDHDRDLSARLNWFLVRGMALAALLGSIAECTPAAAGLIAPSDFQVFAVHPDAQTQGTERGRTLANIAPFNGSLFFGYGDWAWDTGPISIRGLNPATAQWTNSLLTFGTEAVSHFRAIDGAIYATSIDPLGTPGVNPGGFASSPDGTNWSQVSNVAATHVLDITGFGGSELWMVGSAGSDGVIWRSTDGGTSFSTVRADGPAPNSPPVVFSRYTGIAEYQDALFVQRLDVNGAHYTSSLKFDGANWTEGPDLLPGSNGFLHRPTVFENSLVYMDGDKSLGFLYRFDGTVATLAYPEQLRDFFIANGRLYAITSSAELISTSDLLNWSDLGLVPGEAASLAIWTGDLFLGTTDARVLRAGNFENVSAIPEPGLGGLAGVLLVVLFRRRVSSYRRGSVVTGP